MAITIVTGEIDSGKTAWMQSRAEAEGRVSWLSVKVFAEYEFIGYDLHMTPTGGTIPLARADSAGGAPSDWFRFRRFWFNPEAFTGAQYFFNRQSAADSTFILDEVGPLEMEGKGFAPLLEKLLKSGASLMLSVRPSLVEEAQRRFSFEAHEIVRLPL